MKRGARIILGRLVGREERCIMYRAVEARGFTLCCALIHQPITLMILSCYIDVRCRPTWARRVYASRTAGCASSQSSRLRPRQPPS